MAFSRRIAERYEAGPHGDECVVRKGEVRDFIAWCVNHRYIPHARDVIERALEGTEE